MVKSVTHSATHYTTTHYVETRHVARLYILSTLCKNLLPPSQGLTLSQPLTRQTKKMKNPELSSCKSMPTY